MRSAVAEHLRTDIAAMNLDNFIVRPQRRLVEHYAKPESWEILNLEQRGELVEKIAGLPSENVDPDVEAKQFDVLLLSLQLAVLRVDASFNSLRKKVEAIASLLSEKANIPMVRAQLLLIEELQTDEYWQDITLPILENTRKNLRSLVKFIDKQARKPVYTDFEDTLGPIESVDLPAFGVVVNHLTEQGFLDPERLYNSPYVDLSPQGVEGLFTPDQVDTVFATLNQIRQSACA